MRLRKPDTRTKDRVHFHRSILPLVAMLLYWATVDFIGHSMVVQVVFGAVILVPALWATWKLVEMAIAAERYPDPKPEAEALDA